MGSRLPGPEAVDERDGGLFRATLMPMQENADFFFLECCF